MKSEHVIIDGIKSAVVCKVCGKEKQLSLPQECKELGTLINSFIKEHRKCGLKNCYTCAHLEWADGEDSDPAGFTCWKRIDEMNDHQQEKLFKKLDSEKYLKRWKSCYEKKEFKHEQR